MTLTEFTKRIEKIYEITSERGLPHSEFKEHCRLLYDDFKGIGTINWCNGCKYQKSKPMHCLGCSHYKGGEYL
jgi:hypothetical protein